MRASRWMFWGLVTFYGVLTLINSWLIPHAIRGPNGGEAGAAANIAGRCGWLCRHKRDAARRTSRMTSLQDTLARAR